MSVVQLQTSLRSMAKLSLPFFVGLNLFASPLVFAEDHPVTDPCAPRAFEISKDYASRVMEKIEPDKNAHLQGKDPEELPSDNKTEIKAVKLGELTYFIEIFKAKSKKEKDPLISMVVGAQVGKAYGGEIRIADILLLHGSFELQETGAAIFHQNDVLPAKMQILDNLSISLLLRDGFRIRSTRGEIDFKGEIGSAGVMVEVGKKKRESLSPIRLHSVITQEVRFVPIFSNAFRAETGVQFTW